MRRARKQGTAADEQGKRRMFRGRAPRTKQVVIAAGIIGVVAAPVGMAATGSGLREGVRNGTATKETQIIGNFASSTGLTGGYVTRQSNLSSTGGGAVYGCRSGAGGSVVNPPQNPCVRANNLATGLAFEFNATSGNVIGTITSSTGGDSKKPFTTNATGVATGLNADRVDSLSAADIAKSASDTATAAAATDATAKADAAKDRWALIGPGGTILKQTGGFSVVNCYQSNANCYINAGTDVTGKSVTSEILTTNGTNDAGTPVDPTTGMGLTGESSAAPCGLDLVTCAPDGTENANTVVVAPRNSDGASVSAGQGKYAFYVKISAATATP